jgi:hypothetical protein
MQMYLCTLYICIVGRISRIYNRPLEQYRYSDEPVLAISANLLPLPAFSSTDQLISNDQLP